MMRPMPAAAPQFLKGARVCSAADRGRKGTVRNHYLILGTRMVAWDDGTIERGVRPCALEAE